MAKEIERKFLVKNDSYKKECIEILDITQGYIMRADKGVVRIRTVGDNGYITIKTKNDGNSRHEWEYLIDYKDANEMIKLLCEGTIIRKKRYIVPFGGHKWEVDEFTAPRNMVVAEVEIKSENEPVVLPDFIGEEVSGNPAYYNSNIS